jgi:hypothetical protein
VVVQVAGRNAHFLGDDRRVDVRFAIGVEQVQRQLEDAFAGAARRFAFHRLIGRAAARSELFEGGDKRGRG